MSFTAKDVQALREKTSCGMMDCKNALTETNGDMDKAIDFLREKGLATAAKKASRIAAEGLVNCFVDGKIGVVIEVNSETDFVAKNEDFQNFVKNCAITVAKNNPSTVEDLAKCKLEGSNVTVSEMLTEKISTIGENLNIRRFVRVQGNVVTYIHGNGRIGVLIDFDTDEVTASKPEFIEMGKNVCMQIAAMYPIYVDRSLVTNDTIESEKQILLTQINNDEKLSNKPDAIKLKMVDGRIAKFYEQVCLVEQAYVKDGDLTVAKYIESVAKALGTTISIKSFVRFEKGEGLVKKEDNFAQEVASMVK